MAGLELLYFGGRRFLPPSCRTGCSLLLLARLGLRAHEVRRLTLEIMDHEIAFAKAGGLDYWAFLLYEEGSSMSEGLDLYLSRKKKSDMPFCAIAGPDIFGGARQFGARMQRVVKLIGEPSYRKVCGGRPLLYLLDVTDDWANAWGGSSMRSARR